MKWVTVHADKAEQEEIKARLRKLLPSGSRVYTRLEYVSPSGMTKGVNLYAVDKDRRIICLNFEFAKITGSRVESENGLVEFCGGNASAEGELVYHLSLALHKNSKAKRAVELGAGYALKQYGM